MIGNVATGAVFRGCRANGSAALLPASGEDMTRRYGGNASRWRDRVALFDASTHRKIEVYGRDSRRFLLDRIYVIIGRTWRSAVPDGHRCCAILAGIDERSGTRPIAGSQ